VDLFRKFSLSFFYTHTHIHTQTHTHTHVCLGYWLLSATEAVVAAVESPLSYKSRYTRSPRIKYQLPPALSLAPGNCCWIAADDGASLVLYCIVPRYALPCHFPPFIIKTNYTPKVPPRVFVFMIFRVGKSRGIHVTIVYYIVCTSIYLITLHSTSE